MNTKLINALCCLDCGKNLVRADFVLECENCHQRYPLKNQSIFFIKKQDELAISGSPDSTILRIKNYLKQFPRVFAFFYCLTTPIVGKKAKSILNYFSGQDALIINLGSGVMAIDAKIIDVDNIAYPNVSVVADAAHLPFKNFSVDAVISESLLEHMARPEEAISEIKRILKPGGLIYILTPFILGFHSSPNDFYRWTVPGLTELFNDFEKIDSGTAIGPSSALTFLISEWLAMILSFGSGNLYQFWNAVFVVLTTPFNWLDFLLARLNFSSNIARAVYFIGRKK